MTMLSHCHFNLFFQKKQIYDTIKKMKGLEQINRLTQKDLFNYTQSRQRAKKNLIKSFKILGLILLISGLAFYHLSAKSQVIKQPKEKITRTIQKVIPLKLSPEAKEINVLALGIPGSDLPGENLTDTIIIAHLQPNQKKIVLISLPRDLLVKIPEGEDFIKINHLYSLDGLEMLKQKIEEITNLSIDNYILVDLIAVKEIIELVDGLNIFVPQDINDPYFPGPNYSYQAFALKAGWRYLDGQTGLQYIRTRYTSPNGDFDRMARQQQILRAIKQKVLSLNPLWNFPTYLKIFESLREHIKTDLTLMEMKSLWSMAQETETENIISLTIDKERTDLLTGGQIMLGGQAASVLWPKLGQEDYSEIKELIKRSTNYK